MPLPKHKEIVVADKAITTLYNKVGFIQFCEIIGQEPYWQPGVQNQYAFEKFSIFQEAIRDISSLGDFWVKLMDWAVENSD